MPLKEGVLLVVCYRVDDLPEDFVLPEGVTVYFCRGCQKKVYISPSGAAKVRTGTGQPACMACAGMLGDGIRFLPLTVEQIADIRRWRRKDGRA
jgi:hypothetical protein